MRFSACDTGLPVLRPVRALLARIPLGPRPWLHRLRGGSLRRVRRSLSYYGEVRLPTTVHHRLRHSRLPMRTLRAYRHWSDVGSPGSRARSVRTCQGLRPRRTVRRLAITPPSVLPSASLKASASRGLLLSRLNGWPMRSPTDASSLPLRATTHGSGPMWFATPSSWRACTTYSSPVSRRTGDEAIQEPRASLWIASSLRSSQ